MLPQKTKTLIVDGTNLGVQAWFAHSVNQNGVPCSPTGQPIAGCHAVLKRLLQLIAHYEIDELAVVFDNGDTCFRHERYPNYKGGRGEKKDSMVKDVANLRRVFTLLGVAVVAPQGFEADDAIGTLATQAVAAGKSVFVCSGDWDLSQLVCDKCLLLYKRNSAVIEVREADVKARFGVLPSLVADYKALAGDKSDGYPGVDKIGPKMALTLLNLYPGVEALYANLHRIQGNPYTVLKAKGAKEAAFLFKSLASLVLDVPLPAQDFRLAQMQPMTARPFFKELGLLNYLSQYERLCA